jgi:hypothetical protein
MINRSLLSHMEKLSVTQDNVVEARIEPSTFWLGMFRFFLFSKENAAYKLMFCLLSFAPALVTKFGATPSSRDPEDKSPNKQHKVIRPTLPSQGSGSRVSGSRGSGSHGSRSRSQRFRGLHSGEKRSSEKSRSQ